MLIEEFNMSHVGQGLDDHGMRFPAMALGAADLIDLQRKLIKQ
jgi:hypothetical protein